MPQQTWLCATIEPGDPNRPWLFGVSEIAISGDNLPDILSKLDAYVQSLNNTAIKGYLVNRLD